MSFFMTPTGQRVSAALAGIGSIGVFGASWLPHTVYLDKLKEIIHYYDRGMPLPLTDELSTRAQSVLADFTKMNEARKASIQFFHVTAMDPLRAGTPESGYGAIIGLPINFTYHSIKDVHTRTMKLFTGKSIAWMTPAGGLLQESLVLSDAAQRFAIAQQIYLVNTSYVTVNSIAACGAALNVYILSKIINKRLGPKVPFKGRCVVYGLVSLFCYIGYNAITDMVRYKNQRDSIGYVSKLGPVYRQGAIEYYEKQLVRNKALRILLGDKGRKKYTVKGNANTWIRTPEMPLTLCLQEAKRLKKQLEEVCDVCEEISGSKPKPPVTETTAA